MYNPPSACKVTTFRRNEQTSKKLKFPIILSLASTVLPFCRPLASTAALLYLRRACRAVARACRLHICTIYSAICTIHSAICIYMYYRAARRRCKVYESLTVCRRSPGYYGGGNHRWGVRSHALGDSFYGLGDRKNCRPNRKSPFGVLKKGPGEGPLRYCYAKIIQMRAKCKSAP